MNRFSTTAPTAMRFGDVALALSSPASFRSALLRAFGVVTGVEVLSILVLIVVVLIRAGCAGRVG